MPASSPDPKGQASVSDSELESKIRERFAKSKIAEDKFEVRVRSGVAIIEGRTDVPQHKGTATRLARNVGARKVDNRVVVSERGRQKAAQEQRSAPRRVYVKWPES